MTVERHFIGTDVFSVIFNHLRVRIRNLINTLQCVCENQTTTEPEPQEQFIIPNPQYMSSLWQLEAVNALEAWTKTMGTTDICIGIVDDGVYYNHSDLSANFDFERSNVVTGIGDHYVGNLPFLGTFTHGTMVASCAAGTGNKYIVGVAPRCKIASYRFFPIEEDNNGNYITANTNVNDINNLFMNPTVDILNNSWGSSKGYIYNHSYMDGIIQGVKNGRNGKGVISVWASGNDGAKGDSDIYSADYALLESTLNLRETIVVGSVFYRNRINGSTPVDDDYERAIYSESGSCLLCCGPGGQFFSDANNSEYGILAAYPHVSFDNNYVHYTQGTSFAAPIVSGCIALLLSQRNDLTWRDVKEIISLTCKKVDSNVLTERNYAVDSTISEWVVNAAGRNYNINFGYGLIDANAMLVKAETYTLLPPEATNEKVQILNDVQITGNGNEVEFDFSNTNINTVEHVQAYITLSGSKYPYDFTMRFISPSGTSIDSMNGDGSHISEEVPLFITNDFPILCEGFRGEPAVGTWKFFMKDDNASTPSYLSNIRFVIHGH